jgi:hypothetical protein
MDGWQLFTVVVQEREKPRYLWSLRRAQYLGFPAMATIAPLFIARGLGVLAWDPAGRPH